MKILPILPILMLAACGGTDGAEQGETPSSPGAATASPARAGGGSAEALLTSLVEPRQDGRYAPRDECGSLPGAREFRRKLAEAVVRRDADALAELADPGIRLDFGGGGGLAGLRERLADPGWNLWGALENLLPLGCAVNQQKGMTMPWYFAQDFQGDDPFMALVVRGENVPLLAEPSADAKVLARISWDAVTLEESTDEKSRFAKVKNAAGVEGYMAWEDLRSVLDYRLLADRDGEGWKLNALVAGD